MVIDAKTAQKQAAAEFAVGLVAFDRIIGIGSGSTVAEFIKRLAPLATKIPGVVVASSASERIALESGLRVWSLNDALASDVAPQFYFDGADEIEPGFAMIKGGGAALTREKIVASACETFVCLVDESKLVTALGKFALPVEVVPMAEAFVIRELQRLGGSPKKREAPLTDNGNIIIDVSGLFPITPKALEEEVNQIPGVLSNGIFARRSADQLIIAGANVRHERAPVVAW